MIEQIHLKRILSQKMLTGKHTFCFCYVGLSSHFVDYINFVFRTKSVKWYDVRHLLPVVTEIGGKRTLNSLCTYFSYIRGLRNCPK
jgi:hypothetical protein